LFANKLEGIKDVDAFEIVTNVTLINRIVKDRKNMLEKIT
jgi:hypothetical protein